MENDMLRSFLKEYGITSKDESIKITIGDFDITINEIINEIIHWNNTSRIRIMFNLKNPNTKEECLDILTRFYFNMISSNENKAKKGRRIII